jgi:hypothetical protein
VWWSVVEWGGVRWWSVRWWMSTTSFIISIQCIIILCIDVTRACSGEIGQNLLTRHFFSVPPCVWYNRGINLGLLWIARVPHKVKLLLKLIYSRVIAVRIFARKR